MATAKCIENIKKNHAGFNACTNDYCVSVSYGTGVHCSKAQPPLGPDDPVGPQFDPNLNGAGKGGYCYCCCSCFGSYTPIEAQPGEYLLARDINAGEQILATGQDLRWEPRTVQSASTWDLADDIVASMYLLRYGWDGEQREVIVSPDHLFLVEDGTLVAVQDLTKKPFRLRRADGGLSEVLVLAQGSVRGGVTTIQMTGDFDGIDLTGHLLNTNGLVTADFKVQVYYSSHRLSPTLLQEFPPELEFAVAGTPSYHEEYSHEGYTAFLSDPSQWPDGFTPTQPGGETGVPVAAARFLTDAQARDVLRNAPSGPVGNTYPARTVLYLFNVARGFYPNVDFRIDWEQSLPNAYSWSEWGRQIVVVTGGLVRINEMGLNGLSLIISAMIAYQAPEVRCVGEADYAAVADVLHNLWQSSLYVSIVEDALPQVEKVFGYISPKNAQPNPDDRCRQPGIECRIECYRAALSLYEIPPCALPKPQYFELRDARQVRPGPVQLAFNRELDVPTAETVENYVVEPSATVAAAQIGELPNVVRLSVVGLTPGDTYVVRVANVVSNDDVPLDPRHSTGTFTAL